MDDTNYKKIPKRLQKKYLILFFLFLIIQIITGVVAIVIVNRISFIDEEFLVIILKIFSFIFISIIISFFIQYNYLRFSYIWNYNIFFSEQDARRSKALYRLNSVYARTFFMFTSKGLILKYNFVKEVNKNLHLVTEGNDQVIFSKIETHQNLKIVDQDYTKHNFQKAFKHSNLTNILKIGTIALQVVLLYFVGIFAYMYFMGFETQNKIFLWGHVAGLFATLILWVLVFLVYFYNKWNYLYITTYIDFFESNEQKRQIIFDKMKKLFDRPFFVLVCKQVIKENNFVEQIKKDLTLINEKQVEHLLKMEAKINKTVYKK